MQSHAHDLRDRCLDIATGIGTKLAEPESMEMLHRFAQTQRPESDRRDFEPASLFLGVAGSAVLHFGLHQATGDPLWRERGRKHLEFAARSLVTKPTSPGLLGGSAGLFAAACYAARVAGGYATLRHQLGTYLREEAQNVLNVVRTHENAPMRAYDLFDGIAGICIALSRSGDAVADQIIADLAMWLIEDDARWETTRLRDGAKINDIGLAHGIGGMLAALGSCGRTPNGEASVRRILAWLRDNVDIREDLWPHHVEPRTGIPVPPGRVAWCYGTLGVAAAIWTAARKYELFEEAEFAWQAFERVSMVPPDRWRTTDFAICHGTAGIALTARFLARSNGGRTNAMAETALDLTVRSFDESMTLGYRATASNGLAYDSPNLGEGACGIALSLLTCSDLIDDGWTGYLGLPD